MLPCKHITQPNGAILPETDMPQRRQFPNGIGSCQALVSQGIAISSQCESLHSCRFWKGQWVRVLFAKLLRCEVNTLSSFLPILSAHNGDILVSLLVGASCRHKLNKGEIRRTWENPWWKNTKCEGSETSAKFRPCSGSRMVSVSCEWHWDINVEN